MQEETTTETIENPGARATMERKDFSNLTLKAAEDERGVVEGYLAYFGNVDRQGDVIEAGAFKDGPDVVPVFGMHDPTQAIGVGYLTEDEKGLRIKAVLAVDDEDSYTLRERALEYYALAKRGIVRRFSVGMFIQDSRYAKKTVNGAARQVRFISKAEAVEGSLVPIPANDRARVTSVKAADPGEVEALKTRVADLEATLSGLTKAVEPTPAQEQRPTTGQRTRPAVGLLVARLLGA